jgi:hypothetical protein
LQHCSGTPSRTSVAVADRLTGETLGHQNGLWKTSRIFSELRGDWPVY